MNGSARHDGYAAMGRIRGFLGNSGFRRHALLTFDHSSACAAADAYGDADLAIDAFATSTQKDDIGRNYIEVYGVLQAAYLQGNALMRLYDACGLGRLELPSEMVELREVRNEAIAHPAPKPGRGALTATFLGRYTVGSGALALHQYHSDGSSRIRTVNLIQLLDQHRTHCASILMAVAVSLERAERETRQLIAEKGELGQLLHPTWSYMIGKIREASHELDTARATFAKAGLPSLRGMLVAVEEGLQSRGLQPIDSWHMEMARSGLDRLDSLLGQLANGHDVTIDVAAFAEFLERQFCHIQTVLSDMDNELRSAS